MCLGGTFQQTARCWNVPSSSEERCGAPGGGMSGRSYVPGPRSRVLEGARREHSDGRRVASDAVSVGVTTPSVCPAHGRTGHVLAAAGPRVVALPRLIHLNGPSRVGKSTLARRFADEHPGTLALDLDVLAGLVGGWQADFSGAYA